jgi:hypothetical protein
MFAGHAGHLKVFQYLMMHGANTHLKTTAGKTVFDICPGKVNDLLMIVMQTHQTLLSTVNGSFRKFVSVVSQLILICIVFL